jgi:hypothetical protein
MRAVPEKLSESCLYSNIKNLQVSTQLQKFTPNYQLWSDASNKSRWIYLPHNNKINTENPDRWIFPVGTQFFKEFRQRIKATNQEIIVETRHFQKITPGSGLDSWLMHTYKWNQAQTEAFLSNGAENVLGTDHDIPKEQDCIDCHMGNTDIVLGFDAIQLSDIQGKYAFGHGPKRQAGEITLNWLSTKNLLTFAIESAQLPGNELDQKMLGYLHANCGNCHNPLGFAAEQDAKHLRFRHSLSFQSLAQTDVFKTALNQETKNFTAVPYILLGAQEDELALYQSAAYIRMNSTDENYRMPPLARERVDYQALDLLHRWSRQLPTPAHVEFNKDHRTAEKKLAIEKLPERSHVLTGAGLQVELQFFTVPAIPPVIALYWPEDHQLSEQPTMDHKDGFFTDKLILGKQGSVMRLLNSDEVGHTIYVKDKKHDVKWQLNYMPPGSSFEQELFWPEDTFVEMKCRLHLYMSSWAGSISSQYNKIVELKNNEPYKIIAMTGYPEHFKTLKIWLPKFDPITTNIAIGQQQSFDLRKGQQVLGKIRIKRTAQ